MRVIAIHSGHLQLKLIFENLAGACFSCGDLYSVQCTLHLQNKAEEDFSFATTLLTDFCVLLTVLEINDEPQTKIKKISFPQSKTVSNFIDLFLVHKLFCFHKIP